MSVEICINKGLKENWYIADTLFTNGTIFDKNNISYNSNSFANYLLSNENSIESFLNEVNGFFSFIVENSSNKIIYAAVDRIRSIPLFYSNIEGHVILSDSAEFIRERIDSKKFDLLSQKEFLLTGYVTGNDTLFSDIKQIRAGEYIAITENLDGKSLITLHRYYTFNHREPEFFQSRDILYGQLDKVMENCIDRLIKYADNRQIVLPLSAGRDSRLILLHLVRKKYKNIVCFSYGTKNNFEANTSREIAKIFNLRWEYVEYTEEMWKDLWKEPERLEYYIFSSNWTSLPVVQDYPAIQKLKQENLIENDALIVPGHSGDFPAGSHIPICGEEKFKNNRKTLLDLIFSIHYVLINSSILEKKERELLVKKITEEASFSEVNSNIDIANYFEKWDWQERQAKFIVNSIKVYEFFDFDWWLPFWDNEFSDFWENIPLHLRVKKTLYNVYVDALYKEMTGIDPINFDSYNNNVRNEVRKILVKTKLIHPARFIKNILRKKERPGKNNIMCVFGYYPYEIDEEQAKYVKSANGFATISFLKDNKNYIHK